VANITGASRRRAPARAATRALAIALIGVVLLTGCAVVVNAPAVELKERHFAGSPRNVILLIGDGMGVSQVTAGKIELGTLHMERLPVGGICTTFAGNRLVTDSAASGTALATGHKSYNGAISVSPDKRPLKTVLEYAEDRGMATGLVVTCSITHATPAVFAAHVDSREKDREIARQMTASGVDVLFGGGWSYFLPDSEPGGARTDGLNLLNELRERMPVAMSVEEFRTLPDTDAAAAFFAPGHLLPAQSRELSLREQTVRAIDILSRDRDGFFLMVEGSQIDWAGHENDHEWLIDELTDFDEAVGAAMDFAERNGRTLVVVTADHETGAYAVLDGSLEGHEVTRPNFGSGDHSAAMVPVLAYGPRSDAFGGMMDNTDIGRELIETVTRRSVK
jgi:alkaline phosphatase